MTEGQKYLLDLLKIQILSEENNDPWLSKDLSNEWQTKIIMRKPVETQANI